MISSERELQLNVQSHSGAAASALRKIHWQNSGSSVTSSLDAIMMSVLGGTDAYA